MNDGQSATSLLGLPAVLLGELKDQGRFVVISPNLEVSPGAFHHFFQGPWRCTFKTSHILQASGASSVQLFQSLAAWASAGHLKSLASEIGKVIQGPEVDESRMTGAGNMEVIDQPGYTATKFLPK